MKLHELFEAKNQSVASWKRAIKAKHGDKVKYHPHEGTIDAMIDDKQVGHWDDTVGTINEMKVADLKLTVPNVKPRDPNQAVMAAKKNAGGAMRDKKHELKRGELKHKGRFDEAKGGGKISFDKEWDLKHSCGAKMRVFNENFAKPTFKLFVLKEAKNAFQVRLETPGMATGDWQDVHMFADSLDDIATAVGASPADNDAHDRFDLSQLTTLVHKWIGDSPDNQRQHGGWDEMEMDVKSHSDDVLKVSYTFSGWNERRKENVKKKGVITIMPGNE